MNKSFANKENVKTASWFLMRIWFASLLMYKGMKIADEDTVYLLFNRIANTPDIHKLSLIVYPVKGIEFMCGLLIGIGLFARTASALVAFLMLVAIFFSKIHLIDFGNANEALTNIFFWFGCLLCFFGPGKWSLNYLIRIPRIDTNYTN